MSLGSVILLVGSVLLLTGVGCFMIAPAVWEVTFAAVGLVIIVLGFFSGGSFNQVGDNVGAVIDDVTYFVYHEDTIDSKPRLRAIDTAQHRCAPYAATIGDVDGKNIIVYACANNRVQHKLGY